MMRPDVLSRLLRAAAESMRHRAAPRPRRPSRPVRSWRSPSGVDPRRSRPGCLTRATPTASPASGATRPDSSSSCHRDLSWRESGQRRHW